MSAYMKTTLYAIRASRGAGSVFGAAESWVKEQGQVQTFATMAEAEALAQRFNAGLNTPNVRYTAAEFDPFDF